MKFVDAVLLHEGGKHVTNQGGSGEAEEVVLEAVAGQPVFVGVTRKASLQPAKTPSKEDELVGADAPYELRAEVY